MTRGRTVGGALLLVLVGVRLYWFCDNQSWSWMDSGTLDGVLRILIWVVPAIAFVVMNYGESLGGVLRHFGLRHQPAVELAWGAGATIPMAVAAVVNRLVPDNARPLDFLIGAAVLGPFAEEVLFRGFLFRELLVRARWRVGWALAVSALMFGCAHLDVIDYARTWHVLRLSVFEHLAGAPSAAIDGQLIARMALLVRGIALPAVGGGVFAWVFYRTRSLWTAIGLHAGLNLWTTVSMERITASRVGADPRDVAQAASLILAVAMVEMRRRRSARHVARTAAPSSI